MLKLSSGCRVEPNAGPQNFLEGSPSHVSTPFQMGRRAFSILVRDEHSFGGRITTPSGRIGFRYQFEGTYRRLAREKSS